MLWLHYCPGGGCEAQGFFSGPDPTGIECNNCGLPGRWVPLYVEAKPGTRFEAPAPGPDDDTVDLRTLLAEQGPAPKAWDDAARYAAGRLGTDVAALIGWGRKGPDGETDDYVYGKLTDGTATLWLRFELATEPGAQRLEVNVPCPQDDPTCRYGWDVVERRGDLRTVLDGGTIDDPYCDRTADTR